MIVFFRAGFIEAWGRGIEKIKVSCKEAGNPMPEYAIKHGDIMVMFKSLGSQTTQAVTQDSANTIPARSIIVIQKNPTLSQSQIAKILGEKHDTIKYHMRKMKKAGIIKREGSGQKGKWIIL